ncbi:hypothetical protein Srot_1527 [Segniliparus rotundus DSM 44985]|uniref:Uncharacterized protein n=1 Tax=Segniliparus rotundus (strain ATCC BAA-972 / CDC 1076 / CIP 108378 / DSM 44985 / JCM 13578) TaxID=640132 RepID=D6Z7R0_SEGRD|nr:hypothetical protein [Segniliparus rotundus]ADG97990.1 hypothetical protein Srot_1527 [Segniliparus rotundus DSM 44985]
MSIEKLPQNSVSQAPTRIGRGRVVAAPALAVLAMLGATACTREVVVKETPATSSPTASSSSTTTTPSVTVSPINDRAKLCNRAWGRVREINHYTGEYWDAVHKSGFGDPTVNDAGDKFREAAMKALPLLKGLVGPEAPQDAATAINAFADATDQFSDAAGAHSSADEINPLASKYGDALDGMTQACGKG